jgi:hypothetical protein
MKLHVFYSAEHAEIFRRYFLGTLKKGPSDMDVIEHHYVPMSPGNGDFMSDSFLEVIRAKLGEVCRSIAESYGSIIVWSDVDIQFFAPAAAIKDEIARQIEDKDIVFQDEGDGTCNSGFMAIRCSPRTLALFSYVSCLCESYGLNEQPVLAGVLLEGSFPATVGIKWGLLDRRFWATSQGQPSPNILIHHANCTPPMEGLTSIEIKKMHMDEVRSQFELYLAGLSG